MASFSSSLWYSLCFTSTFNTSSLCFYLYSHCFYHRHYYYYHHYKKRLRILQNSKNDAARLVFASLQQIIALGIFFECDIFSHIQIIQSSLVMYSHPEAPWNLGTQLVSEHRDEKSRLASVPSPTKVDAPRLDHKTGRKIRNAVKVCSSTIPIRAGNMNLILDVWTSNKRVLSIYEKDK